MEEPSVVDAAGELTAAADADRHRRRIRLLAQLAGAKAIRARRLAQSRGRAPGAVVAASRLREMIAVRRRLEG